MFAGSFVCQVSHGFIGASSFCGCCCGWFCMFGSSHGLVGGRLASLSPPQIQMRKSFACVWLKPGVVLCVGTDGVFESITVLICKQSLF